MAARARRAPRWGGAGALLAVVLGFASGAAAQTQLGIVWDDVPLVAADQPTALTTAPQGCTCYESNTNDCNAFECECVCDLTAGACDDNCCCDNECSAEQVATFETCLPAGPLESSLILCVDLSADDLLAEVNPSDRLVALESRSAADNMLCVAEDNNPSKGDFYSVPTLPVADTELDPKDSFTLVPAERAESGAAGERASSYAGGTAMPTQRRIEGTWAYLYPLAFPVRAAGAGGECVDDGSFVSFLDDGTTVCVQQIPASAASPSQDWCADFAAINFLDNVRVAKVPSANTGAAFEMPTISETTLLDLTTGTSQTITLATEDMSLDAGALANRTTDACTCNFATKDVHYTFNYNYGEYEAGVLSFHISSVTAALTVVHLTDCAGQALERTFSHSFQYAGTAPFTASAAEGNQLTREMSGNPGYIYGKPVVTGVLTETEIVDQGLKRAINMFTDGLQLRGPAASGACSSSGDLVSVGFGEDMQFSCFLDLTAADLATRCDSSLAIAAVTEIGFTVPTADAMYVGLYGNADPYKTWEWVAVDRSAESTTGPACPRMVTGFDVTILWAKTGERSNPQPRIISVVSTPRTEFVSTSGTEARRLTLTTSVSFKRVVRGEATEFVPPAPPLLPEVPNDLFFPFQIASDGTATISSATANGVSAVALLAMALSTVLLQCVGVM